MLDETARFAARLARSVGRLDWWNVYEEHTGFQWACQLALDAIEPFGDKRNDIRAARHTANLMLACSQRTEPMPQEDFADMVRTLQNYLLDARDFQDQDDLEALKLMKGK